MKARSLVYLAGLVTLLTVSACPGQDQQTTPDPDTQASSSDLGASASSVPSSPGPSQSGPSQPSSKPASVLPPTNKSKRGIFVYGDGYQTFKACGSKEEVWVLDTAQKDLQKQYLALKLMELEPVYVELDGQIVATDKKDGFASDYQHSLKVSKLHSLRPWRADGSCFETDFVAEGARPNWRLQVLKAGDVFFKAEEGEFSMVDVLAYSAPKQQGNQTLYEFAFRTPDAEKLQASFTQEACTYQGKAYSHRAEVQFRGTTYTGCADQF